MRLAIIETGAPPEALLKTHGDYPAMFERLFAPFAPRLSFFTMKADDLPPFAAFDGLLITGSSAGVYEGHDWIAPLEEFLRRSAIAKKRQVGICFGHQLMAQAFGGRVEKSAKGWGVGVQDYEVTRRAASMTPAPGRFSCATSHQDQVVAKPPGAETLATSEFCEFAALEYAQGPAISFQMHPEFEHDCAADLLRLRSERISAALSATTLDSLKRGSVRTLIARWIANFYIGDRR